MPICDVIGDVPAIAMKGISKEFPWPGSRCGWIEVYNGHNDEHFRKYINLILTGKMNEVCSTTLPQTRHPGHHAAIPNMPVYLAERIASYERMSNITYDFLSKVPALQVNRTNGAFYMAVAFKDGLLNNRQTTPDRQPRGEGAGGGAGQRSRASRRTSASSTTSWPHTGICIVPLSSFSTPLQGSA